MLTPQRVGVIHGHGTFLSVTEEHVTEEMFRVFAAVCRHLYQRGFTVRACPETQKRYRCLSRTTRIGIKEGLEFEMKCHGRVLDITFFQNLNIEHKSGGKYDYQKLGRMTRAMRLQCLSEMIKLVRLFQEMGYTLGRKAFPISSESLPFAVRRFAEERDFESPLDSFNASWNSDYDWARGGRFKRDETGWPTFEEYGKSDGNVDRDRRVIRNGDVKYYRHWDGRLLRATVYTNMNNRWCVDSGVVRTYVSSEKLFDCERPDLEPRRAKPDQIGRLHELLKKALEAKDYRRVAELGAVMARLEAETAKRLMPQNPIASGVTP